MEDISNKQVLQYVLTEKIGEGTTGAVYKAWDATMERVVALRWLRQDLLADQVFRARCLSTLRTMTDLVHPNIGTVYGATRTNGNLLIVMEYIEGQTLQEKTAQGRVDNKTFIDYALQIARGLAHAQKWHIVHGSIRLSNIMVASDGTIKIVDFGLLRDGMDSNVDDEHFTNELRYHSPEQVAGHPATMASDLFSLGAVFWELLTGRPVFEGHSREEVEKAVLRQNPDFHNLRHEYNLPGDTVLLVEKLLAKEPAERLQSAEEMQLTLEAMKSFDEAAPTREFLQVKPTTPRQYALLSVLAVLLVILWLVITTIYK